MTATHAWPGANTPVANKAAGRIAADEPDQRIAEHSTLERCFLRLDRTHELPLVVETESGRTIARFARNGDLARFLNKNGTIPASLALQIKEAS